MYPFSIEKIEMRLGTSKTKIMRFLLKNAAALGPSFEALKVDGNTIIFREQILLIQWAAQIRVELWEKNRKCLVEIYPNFQSKSTVVFLRFLPLLYIPAFLFLSYVFYFRFKQLAYLGGLFLAAQLATAFYFSFRCRKLGLLWPK